MSALLCTIVLVALEFTAPSSSSRGVCEVAGDTLRYPIEIRLMASRPSSTWRDSAEVLRAADVLTWRRLWPVVRDEAEERLLREKLVAPGAGDSFEIPGSWGTAWLVPRKPWNGRLGCASQRIDLVTAAAASEKHAPAPAPARATPLLEVSPSPAGSTLTVQLAPGPLLEGARVEVRDIAGRTWYARRYPLAVRWRITIDVATWPAGIYFVEARVGSVRAVRRVAVLH